MFAFYSIALWVTGRRGAQIRRTKAGREARNVGGFIAGGDGWGSVSRSLLFYFPSLFFFLMKISLLLGL